MLVIGHRGAAGLAPENTIEALKKGRDASADMLEFDVQLTRDKVPIVIHDSTLFRTHRKLHRVKWSKHSSIIVASENGHQIATLEDVLDEFFGKIILNLEVKSRGTGLIVAKLIRDHYIKKPEDWSTILISSFHVTELSAVRGISKQAELGLLHHRNPFLFIAHHRRLKFSAVGFHRLYINTLALEIAKRAELFTYVYTVDRPETAERFARKQVDAVVTNHPDKISRYLSKQSA